LDGDALVRFCEDTGLRDGKSILSVRTISDRAVAMSHEGLHGYSCLGKHP
jgi:hypothetical protein